MSTINDRALPPDDGGSVELRLTRLLDTRFLTQVVPHLAPETLHQLIQYRGLDACGEIVTSATPAQLTSLLDLDLWRHTQPGRDEQFNVERFGEWLEVLVDAGEVAAARTVAALDKDIVIAGLARYVRVFDPGTFEPTAATDDEAIERHDLMNSETSRDVAECEVGGYLVRARRTDAWDAIVALLVTMEIEHHDDFHALMQGCRHLSNSSPEEDGFHDLPLARDQHLHDVAIDRENRRSRQGYATPADARAFLQMARHSRASQHVAIGHLAASYFHQAEAGIETRAAADDNIAASITVVNDLLAEAGVVPERPRALLTGNVENSQPATLLTLRRLMDHARQHDEAAHLARGRELAFLANTLLAGCSVQSRPFTPREASDAAACICNLGLECASAVPVDNYLVDHDLVAVFETGWATLYRDVSLFAMDQLIATLGDLHGVDLDLRREVLILRRTLLKHREAGTPWLARGAAEVLASLDITAWAGVIGLLDECPILPAALTAVLERTTTTISPTAFEFISTPAQLGDIRVFMSTLPMMLSS